MYEKYIYLARSKEVADFAKEAHQKWLHDKKRTRSRKDTNLRRFSLGFENGKPYVVNKTILMAEKCRERWDLLETEEK